MAKINELWEKIHAWLAKNAPEVNSHFRKGASEKEIQKLEDVIGVQLPEDFKASYKIHNGHTSDGSIFEDHMFMSIKEIIRNWKIHREVLDEYLNPEEANNPKDPLLKIQAKWWDPKWIPFAQDGCGNFLKIDLAPADSGKAGQVIQWYHDDDERKWLAPTFTQYLEKYITDLEAGEYEVNSEYKNCLQRLDAD